MKFLVFASIFVVLGTFGSNVAAQAKISEAASVAVTIENRDKLKVGTETQLVVEVTPKAGWHIYSATVSEEDVYRPAEVGFDMEARGFEAQGKLTEDGKLITEYDDILGGQVRYYKGKVTFSQKIKVIEPSIVTSGYFDYMACNDEKCIMITAEFKLSAKAAD